MDEIEKRLVDDAIKEIVLKDKEVSGVICGYASEFEDDIWTICPDCGKDICYRSYVPKEFKKICVACMVLRRRKQKGVIQ